MEVTQAELSSDIYNKTFDLEELKQIVAPIAEKYGLEAVYLFGSQARGDAKPDSDFKCPFHRFKESITQRSRYSFRTCNQKKIR